MVGIGYDWGKSNCDPKQHESQLKVGETPLDGHPFCGENALLEQWKGFNRKTSH